MTDVYLEVGKKRVFACAADWPGWCRSGRDEEQALEALTTSASRYAVLAALAGIPFDPVAEVDCIEIAETVTGSATTDFGALDVAPALDAKPVTAQQADRLAALVQTAWDYFEQTAAASPPALRKGPRGGGRDRPRSPGGPDTAPARISARIAARTRASAAASPAGKGRSLSPNMRAWSTSVSCTCSMIWSRSRPPPRGPLRSAGGEAAAVCSK